MNNFEKAEKLIEVAGKAIGLITGTIMMIISIVGFLDLRKWWVKELNDSETDD